MTINETELLEMALIGYAMKRENIEREQDRIRLLLQQNMWAKESRVNAAVAQFPKDWSFHVRNPRKLSPAGRARIIAATKARWARYRKAQKGGRK